jgi:hypothetical protein
MEYLQGVAKVPAKNGSKPANKWLKTGFLKGKSAKKWLNYQSTVW